MSLPSRAACLLFAFAAICAAADTSQVITFDGALDIALERNADLLQAQVTASLSDVAVSTARMAFVPTLTLDTAGARNIGRSFDQTQGVVLSQTTNSATLGATSGLTLFDGLRDVSTLRQAKFSRTASHLDLSRARETLVFTVASNFLSLMQRQELLDVLRDNLAGEANLAQQIKQYVEAGTREAAVLYQQEANVAAARLAVVQTQADVDSAQVDLMRTLQLDPAGTYEFRFPETEKGQGGPDANLADLLKQALEQRADLKAEAARLSAAEQGLKIAHGEFWPTLFLNAGYSGAYSSASEVNFKDQIDQQRGGALTLDLSIPVFDRGAARNDSRNARLKLRSERITFDTLREEVGLQVREAYQEYRSAREQLATAEAQKKAAERAVETAQERFKSGVTSLVEVTQARAVHIQAASALVAARANWQLQRISLEYFLGHIGRRNLAGGETAPAE